MPAITCPQTLVQRTKGPSSFELLAVLQNVSSLVNRSAPTLEMPKPNRGRNKLRFVLKKQNKLLCDILLVNGGCRFDYFHYRLNCKRQSPLLLPMTERLYAARLCTPLPLLLRLPQQLQQQLLQQLLQQLQLQLQPLLQLLLQLLLLSLIHI